MAIAFIFTFVFAMLLKDSSKKTTLEEAYAETQKTVSKLTLIVSLIAIVAFALLLIIGTTLLKNFALIALVGTVLNMATILYVMPGLAKK